MSSWSKPLSLTDAVRQLDVTSSVHRLYNALVVIRTNYSKGTESLTALRHHGGVEKLLNVLTRSNDSRCHDVTLSILGNCCMNEKCILRVLKSDDGIRTICNTVRDAEKESIRNRGCRVLANLCQVPACCDIIHEDHADVLGTIVSHLSKTTDKDCQVTFCRTIRMLSDTAEHREAMLSHRVLKPVASLLRSDDATLLLSAVKTVSCFIHGCSEEAVRQLVSEGALKSVVALTSRTDATDIVSAASSLLLSIASNAPSLRQYLGRAGAVEYFVSCLNELVTSDGTLPHKYRIIDALCQCCRDANNRIKIREQGGLSVLTSLLSNDMLTAIHDRIISALVCFIYDDASIAVLLQNHLVHTLVSHLHRAAEIVKKPDFIGLDSFGICESLRMASRETTDNITEDLVDAYICTNDLRSAAGQLNHPLDTSVKQNNNLVNSDSVIDFGIGKDGTDIVVSETFSAVGVSIMQTDQFNDDSSQGKPEFVGDEPVVSEPDAAEGFYKPSRYSINSPTYKAVSAWRMESAADEEEGHNHERHSPRNIWEGARLYGENFSSAASRSGSVSPTRSVGSCSDGLCSVPSWSSSLCSSSPQKSPGVSPAWSLDSSASGVYSPFSNSSYVYSDGACSPLSFCDMDEAQPVSLSRCQCSESQLDTATACHVSDSQAFQAHCVSVTDVHSESSANVNLTENAVIDEPPEFVTDVSDVGRHNDNVGTSSELLLRVDIILEDEIGGGVSAVQSKLEGSAEEESKEQCSDDEFDAQSFQLRRQDERKFSRLLDIAQSMYASIETEPIIQSHQTKKRRRSSSGSTSPSVPIRQKFPCHDVSVKIENKSYTTETRDTNDVEDTPGKSLQNPSITDDTNSCAVARSPQCLLLAVDTSHGEGNSDTESLASDDTSSSSVHHQNVSLVTERNILTLLSRISHSPETIAHVMNAGTICGLLDYVALASNPLPAAGRTLLRLSRSHHAFQRAVLCLFTVQAAWRMEPDGLSSQLSDSSCRHHGQESRHFFRDISRVRENDTCMDSDTVDHVASGKDSVSCKHEIKRSEITEIISKRKKGDHCSSSLSNRVSNKSAEAECAQECVISKLCDEIIANLSTVAISGYGQGVISHLLLRGNHHQRERCVISLCILCRNNEMRAKFLMDMHGIDVLMQLILTPNSPLFSCAVLSLSHQARCLQLTSSCSDSASSSWTECLAVDADDFDLMFVMDDGSRVNASRRVMSRSSDVFAAMLGGGFRESTERDVRISDAASDAFQTMVAWLHGRTSKDNHSPELEELCELLPLFHRFQIPDAVRRRTLLPPLIAAVFDGDEDDEKFARIYRLLSVYDDIGSLKRDCVVSVFTRQMSLRRRCAAITGVISADSECDIQEFVSIISAALLDAIN